MPNKGLLWGAAYSAFSLTSFGISLFVLASKSYDFLTLLQELTDNFRLPILLNFIVFCFLLVGFIGTLIIFRQIRIIEIEHIAEQMPFYGINLLFILFNDHNLILNMVWAGLTVLLKVYHIIAKDRVDLFHVQVVNRMSLHHFTKLRILGSFLLNGHVLFLAFLLAADMIMARILAYDVFQGVGSMGSLLFGIEFGVMAINCFAFLGKLALNVYELVAYRCAEFENNVLDDEDEDDLEEYIWENRAIYVQGFEIMISLLKAIFFSIMLYTLYSQSHSGWPITIIQGCVVSIHLAAKQIYQFSRLFTKSRRLEDQLASPTEEELVAADHMCIICREDMHFPETFANERGKPLNPRKHPKKLHCSHILHLSCLKDWLERSDSCPLCRKVVFDNTELTSESQENLNLPPDAAPGDRPIVPNETDAPNPTPTSAIPLDPEHPEVSGSTLLASSYANTLGSSTSEMNLKPMFFVPRDWALFPMSSTSDPQVFNIRFSASQNAQLTIRRNRDLH